MAQKFICILLASLFAVSGAAAADFGTGKKARPAGAAPLAVSGAASIDRTLKQNATARVIVRLAPPAELPAGFAVESHVKDKGGVARQRAAIAAQQQKVLAKVSASHGKEAKAFEFIPYMAMEVDAAEWQTLLASPEVELVEEDLAVPPTLQQSVPLIGGDAAGAFFGYTGNGQTVAILDTGVDKTHPFLTGKVVAEACFSTTDATSTAFCTRGSTADGAGANCDLTIDGCQHGTHVAGIAAGKGTSFSGVASDATIIAVQVFSKFPASSCGGSAPCPMSLTSDRISALQHIYNLRTTYNIAAVNMSLGGGSFTSNCDANTSYTAEKAAIDTLRSAGIATVISSGNEYYTNSIGGPACISTAVSVGATDKTDKVAPYSNSATLLKLLAPGSAINSSIPGGGFAAWDGTSMAAPHVTGAWAVLKSAKPAATVDEILTALTTTGRAVTDGRNSIVKPRIQVDTAVLALNNTATAPLTVAKTGSGTGTVSGSMGITCGATCTANVPQGATITLVATPGVNAAFTGWSGACTGTAATCTFTMGGAASAQANFILTAPVASELFNLATLPAGWSVIGSPGWRFNNPGGRTNLTGGGGSFAIADSDNAGQTAMNTELRSPGYSFAGYSKAYLSFKTYFLRNNAEVCDVDISTDGGTAWTNVWRKSASYSTSTEHLDISALAAGQADVRVRFHYYGANWDWYWQVDDFALNGWASYAVTPSVNGGNGTVSPDTPVSRDYGATATFTLAPAVGYQPSATVGGTCPAGSFTGNSYTTGAITADCSVIFSFTPLSYTIGTATSGNGTITCTPAVTVTYGAVASCTATPAASNHIGSVTVDGIVQTISDPSTFTHNFGAISADHSISAIFAPDIRTLTVSTAGSGSGRVTDPWTGIDCGTTCTAEVAVGTTVTLVASPAADSVFSGWSGACTGTDATCTFVMSGMSSAQASFLKTLVVASETFDAGALPTGWSVTGDPGWRFDDPGARGNQTGGSGSFAIADSDNAGSVPMDTELRSPGYNLAGASAAYLKFKSYFRQNNVEICDADISTDGGTTWSNVWRAGGSGYEGGTTRQDVSLDISALAVGQADVQVRFHHYDANYDWYWQVDDFALSVVASSQTVTAGVNGGNGTVSSTNPLSVMSGATATFTLAPATGYQPSATVGGTCPAGSFTGNSYSTGPIAADCTVEFSFMPLSYTIAATTSGNGTIACSPAATVTYGTVTSCTATPATGNHIASVSVDGIAQTISDPTTLSYSFGAIGADHTIHATFAADTQTVTISTAGSGSGRVTSTPAGIDCGSGTTNACSAGFNYTMAPTLTAIADWHSVFAGWSGACSGSGGCTPAMNASTSVIATFNPKQNVKITGTTPTYYATLQTAYYAATGSATVQAGADTFFENLLLNQPTILTLQGGLDSGFLAVTGFTTVSGSVTVGNGTLIVENLTIR